MTLSAHLEFFTALFVILNPIGVAPLFASLTEDMAAPQRARVALVTAIAVFVTCTVCAFGGRFVLEFFGIDINDLQVAGGLVVLLIGLGMINAQPDRTRHTPAETAAGRAKPNPAVVPLAIPLTSGPGAMATAILSSAATRPWSDAMVIAATILVCSILVYVIYRSSGRLERVLGVSGMGILTRVMGLVVAAIAIKMIATGMRQLFPMLGAG